MAPKAQQVPAVECEHLTHRYGDLVAVNDLTLEIERAQDDDQRSAALKKLRDALRSSKD